MKDKDIKCYLLNNIEITSGDEINFNEDTQIYWEILYYIKQCYIEENEDLPKYILFNTHVPNTLQIYIYRNNINYHKLFKYIQTTYNIITKLNNHKEINKIKEKINIEFYIV